MTAVTALEHDLRVVLPRLSVQARAIVDALLLSGGSIGSATRVAERLGLPSRFALGRMLRRQGLPGLRELAAWVSLLDWVILTEHSQAPLFAIATHARRNPAVCYRTVKRLTGLTWAQLKGRGSRWVLRQFIARCRAIRTGRRAPAIGRHGLATVNRSATSLPAW
jgi:hypothetical protein